MTTQLDLSGRDATPRIVDGVCVRCAAVVDNDACDACVDAIVVARVCDVVDASPSTVKQYSLGYRSFLRFALLHRATDAIDGDNVAAYLAHRLETGITPRTIAHDYACLRAIAGHHGTPLALSPALRALLRTLGRRRDDTPIHHARPLRPDDLTAIVRRPSTGLSRLQHHRDTAVVLLGWSIGARPQDVASLRWRDLSLSHGVLTVSVQPGKTRARIAHVLPSREAERCPIAAVRRWSGLVGVDLDDLDPDVAAFAVVPRIDRWGNYRRSVAVSSEAVAAIVRNVATAANLGPGFGGGSLRAGFVSSAAEAGIADRDIAAVTGHRSLSALQRYRREVSAFSNPALKLL